MTGKPFHNPLLEYGLGQGVLLQKGEDGVWLLMKYPLKAVRFHPDVGPLLECLAQDGLLPLNKLSSMAPQLGEVGLQQFLNSLVRKGFVQISGTAALNCCPMVSIIIPVRNRPDQIDSCLDSLQRLNYPSDRLEIIVVNDGSDDGLTSEVVSGSPVRLMELSEQRGASYCRNLGASQANGKILAFVDSDCRVDPDWLYELIPAFEDPALAAVGGLVDGVRSRTSLDRYEKVRSSLFLGKLWKRSVEQDHSFYVPSCNLLTSRNAFVEVGGFRQDLEVGEDVDLCWRLQDMGKILEYRPQGAVAHMHRNSLIGFAGRRFKYGTSEPLLQSLHPGRRKTMVWPPKVIIFWLLLASGLSFSSPALLGLGLLLPLVQAWQQQRVLQGQGVNISLGRVLAGVLRSRLAFAYLLCSFLSRYWLLWALPLLPIWPGAAVFFIAVQLLVGVVEYRVCRPRLWLPVFIFLLTVEQCAYQAGVWYGCWTSRCFGPLNPKLVIFGRGGD